VTQLNISGLTISQRNIFWFICNFLTGIERRDSFSSIICSSGYQHEGCYSSSSLHPTLHVACA